MQSRYLRCVMRASILLITPIAIALACLSLSARAVQTQAGYTNQIEPIFQQKCVVCHNHTTRKGDLNLESYEGLMNGGKRGAAIIPGKSGESLLIKMIEGSIKPRMPLGDELSPDEIKTIRAWVDAGAPAPSGAMAKAEAKPIESVAKANIPNSTI
ncbi:MAG: hypothetical protein M3X11_09780, partial [Acidobacteriota bacterium]|nr:hypothetical protein [Acidobacteriota bacterium]